MQALLAQGAQNISAVPAQLCLPCRAGFTSAAITTTNAEAELTLRISEQEGIGLPLVIEQKESAVNEALLALNLMVPAGPVVLYVPHSELGAYQAQISTIAGLEQRVTLTADHWSNWIAGAKATDLNLATGLGAGSGMQLNWRPWRWPLALAAVALAVNIVGLNLDWWRMQREATQLRTNMIQIYKTTYPKETVVLDPVAQMRQKAAAAQTAAGRLTTDDFLALAARLGQSFGSVAQSASSAKTGVPAVATLEYRDRSLWLKLKAPADSAAEQLKAALAAQGLFVFESDAGTWKIRSTK
jgi:general secretion pathway protein L